MKKMTFKIVVALVMCSTIIYPAFGSDLVSTGILGGIEGTSWSYMEESDYTIGFFQGMVLVCDPWYCIEVEGSYINTPLIGYFSHPEGDFVGFAIPVFGIGWVIDTAADYNGPMTIVERNWVPGYIAPRR